MTPARPLLAALLALLPAPPRAAAPTDLVVLMQSAAAAYRQERLDEALSLTAQVLERDPANGAARNYAWTIARKIKDRDDRAVLTSALKKQGLRRALEDIERRRRRARQALSELKKSDRRTRNLKSPQDLLAGMEGLERLLGQEFADERDQAAAEAHFNRILGNLSVAIEGGAFVTKKDQAWAEGFLAYYGRDWKAAERLWAAALAEDPSDGRVRKDLESLRALMRRQETEERVRKLSTRAETYERTGYFREAAESWAAVLALDPSRAGVKQKLIVARAQADKEDLKTELARMTDEGLGLYQRGDVVGAAQVWLEALQKDPSYERARVLLAQAGRDLKAQGASPPPPAPPAPKTKSEDAAPPASPGVVFSSSTRAMELYKEGIMHYTENDLKAALAAWKEALRHDPGMSKARQAVRQAETELAFQ